MYKNYYDILEVLPTASQDEIKKSYRKLAKKWHPDVNNGIDTTSKMQDITEAYLILSDIEARKRYDKLYEFHFKKEQEEPQTNEFEYSQEGEPRAEGTYEDIPRTKYQSGASDRTDPILDDWILKAKNQAKEFVLQSVRDAKGITANGCKYTVYSIGITIVIFIAILVLIIIWRAVA